MRYFAPKQITVDQIQNNYNLIVSQVHFIAEKQKIPKDENLKQIENSQIQSLMIMGLEGLHFLSKILKGFDDIEGITEEIKWEAYCLCDGFGKQTSEKLREINDGWDWSHIRDSSNEAKKEAELFLKQKLVDIYNNHEVN